MKKILVPTDFSAAANRAKEVAYQLASQSGAEIHFLHSVYTPIDWVKFDFTTPRVAQIPDPEKDKLYDELTKKIGQAKWNLMQLVDEAEKRGLSAYEHLAYDYAHKDIGVFAEKLEVDLIVMGTHGEGGTNDVVLGNNTVKVLRNATVPVLTVKHNHPDFQVEDIVFSSDFEEDVVPKVFKRVLKFSKLLKSKTHLLFVNTPVNFEDTNYSMVKMAGLELKFIPESFPKHIFNEYSVEEGINGFVKTKSMDMIAMGTHGFKGIKRLLNDNIAEKVVLTAEVPVLTVNMRTIA